MYLRLLAAAMLAALAVAPAVAAPPRRAADCFRCHAKPAEAARVALAMEAPPPVVGAEAKADDIPRGRKLLYFLARNRAIDDVQAKYKEKYGKPLGRAAAKKLIEDYADNDTLHGAVMAAELDLKGAPVGGPIEKLIDWLIANPELVKQIIALIISLIPLFIT